MIENAPDKPKKQRAMLTVDLGSLKADWLNYCRLNKTKSSPAIKQVIKRLIGVGRGGGTVYKVISDAEPTEKKRMTIRWTKAEFEAIEQEAGKGVVSPTNWVIDLVRANLTRTPQFSMKEIEALWESSAQLMKIGSNLNQIARAINRNPLETDKARVELIEKLGHEIKDHTRTVTDLLNANLKRWDIK